MAYTEDEKPSGLTALTSLENDDTIIIGDTSDTSEVVKTITWANLKTLLSSPYVTVGFSEADYICDGTADDVQIQDAIDYVDGLGGGTVFIKSGTYDITSGLVLYDNTSITGSQASILKRPYSVSTYPLIQNQYSSGGTTGNTNIKVSNLVLDCGGDLNSYNEYIFGIMLNGVSHASVSGVTFTNLSGDGVYLSSGTGTYNSLWVRSNNISVTNNHFIGDNSNRNGVSIIDAEDVVISNNTFYKVTSTSHPGAIDLEPNNTDQVIRNVTIANNTFDSCHRGVILYNIFPSSGRFDGVTIIGNTYNDSLLHDIQGLSFANVNISSNVHRNPAVRAIQTEGMSTLNIIGNSIYFSQSSSIYVVSNGSVLNITGNTIVSAGGHAIWLNNVTGTNISGNNIRGWGVGASTYRAVYGEVAVSSTNISGNVFNNTESTAYTLASAGTSTNWSINANKFISSSGTEVSLVGTNFTSIESTSTLIFNVGTLNNKGRISSGVAGTTRGSIELLNQSGQPSLVIDGFSAGVASVTTASSVDRTVSFSNSGAGLMHVSVEGDVTADRINYDRAIGGVNAIGNLGATETIDWSTHTHYTGTLDSNITFTYSNQVSGQSVTLYLTYDGTSQKTITWPTTIWLDNDAGAAPSTPAASGNVLIVTLSCIGTTIYASATGNYAVYA